MFSKTILTTIALTLTVIITQASVPSSELVAKRSYNAVCVADEEQCIVATRILFDAIDKGDNQKIDLALNNGADVNAASKKYQALTPLMLAVRYNNLYAAQMLIRHGAAICAINIRGKTALDEAIIAKADQALINLLRLSTAPHMHRPKTLLALSDNKLSPYIDAIWEDVAFQLKTSNGGLYADCTQALQQLAFSTYNDNLNRYYDGDDESSDTQTSCTSNHSKRSAFVIPTSPLK